ncbi:MAG: hypothetical protein FWD25_01005 [Clostridia bacterium]|nr:hypothetical protein [Clostridia bacterium]
MKQFELKDAFPAVPASFERRIRHTALEMEQVTMKRQHKFKVALVCALVSVALLSVAIAASLQWGVLDFLIYRDEDGNPVGEAYLAPMVKGVNLLHQTDDFSLTVHDYICDGTALSTAWTFDNKSDEALFLYHSLTLDGKYRAGFWMGPPSQGYYLPSGQSADVGAVWTIEPQMQAGETLTATLEFDVIRSKAEFLMPEMPTENSSQADWDAYLASCFEAMESDRLVVQLRELTAPRSMQSEIGSDLDRMLEAGLVERVDQFGIQIPITVQNEVKSALADGQPIQKQMDGYVIFITRADLYPNATYIDLEYVFDTEADMLALARSRAGWLNSENGRDVMLGWVGCYIGSLEEVSKALSGSSQAKLHDIQLTGFGFSTHEVQQRRDGKWVVSAQQQVTPLLEQIREITIVPVAYERISDTETKELFYLEDAIQLSFID